MGIEIIHNVAYDTNYKWFFNMSTSYFSQIFISLFWGLLFNDETDLRVKTLG